MNFRHGCPIRLRSARHVPSHPIGGHLGRHPLGNRAPCTHRVQGFAGLPRALRGWRCFGAVTPKPVGRDFRAMPQSGPSLVLAVPGSLAIGAGANEARQSPVRCSGYDRTIDPYRCERPPGGRRAGLRGRVGVRAHGAQTALRRFGHRCRGGRAVGRRRARAAPAQFEREPGRGAADLTRAFPPIGSLRPGRRRLRPHVHDLRRQVQREDRGEQPSARRRRPGDEPFRCSARLRGAPIDGTGRCTQEGLRW